MWSFRVMAQWTAIEGFYLLVVETAAASTLFLTGPPGPLAAATSPAPLFCLPVLRRVKVPPRRRIQSRKLLRGPMRCTTHTRAPGGTLVPAVFYWTALAGSGGVSADNVLKHGANNAMILLDVVLSRVPFVSYHFQVHRSPPSPRDVRILCYRAASNRALLHRSAEVAMRFTMQ